MSTRGSSGVSVADYVTSDYLTLKEQKDEADVPVPEGLLPKSRRSELVRRLKRSQRLGILVWLESIGRITLGGRARLSSLLEGSSVEAILAGQKFSLRLSQSDKLQLDFRHVARELNTRPRSGAFRRKEKRRIGVGYRDKGTLPSFSSRERQMAQQEAWVPTEGIPDYTLAAISSIAPFVLSEDGDHLDAVVFAQYLKPVWALPQSWGLPSS